MKTHTYLALIFIFFHSDIISINAQSCEGYFPSKKGAVLEMTMYNEKDKKQGTSTVTIQDITNAGGKTNYKLHSEMLDAKDKPTSNADYEAFCENNNFYISMKSMIPSEQMKAWENMEVSMKAEDIQYPSNPKPGDKLPDAHLTVSTSMSGMKMPDFNIDITDRVVAGTESVTTPAGTFECIKVTANQKIKSIVSYEMNSIEWISKGNGVVKSQSFKGDKLKGYTLLTAVK